uniref:4-amino-4-deoxy-L-arabinose transferase and related glycosyltransferases of PMT family-like protein n=1 Tax=Solibacter usitatus (strain Ellin6076) TaxID=234267 RepID=Q022F5_SOLUE
MSRIACIILAILFAATSLGWVMLDRSPPTWDDAWYLTNSLTVYDALAHGGIGGYLARLNNVFGFKAPLIAALPAPFYLVFGRRWHSAYLVNIAAMFVLFAALHRLARRWGTPRAAVFAIVIAGTMPLLYGLSRWYLVEYVMTALEAVAICALADSDFLLFGVLSGFGLLLKVSYPLFVLPVFLYVWSKSARRARNLLMTAIPCLALALPWYLGHLLPTLANALDAGFGAPAGVQGTGPIFALRTIGVYLSHVIATGTSYYFFLLALALTPWALRRSAWKTGGPVLAAWLLPFALFVFGGNKDVRYIAPVLPAAALAIALTLDAALPRNRTGDALAALLLAFPAIHMFAVSFGVPYRVADQGYTRTYNRISWPHDEMLKLIAANANLRYGEQAMVLVGVDRGSFNANNIELTAVALQLPFNIETTAHEDEFNVLKFRVTQAAFILFKEGGEPESPAFNPYAVELARMVAADSRFREIPCGKPLPDGGVARIYQRR